MTDDLNFIVSVMDSKTSARYGVLNTNRGEIKTPVFIPIGTYGAVKALSPLDLETAGASIILGNTYHLFLRPGIEIIEGAGGLHSFMAWNRPILTDSGGFQVFSLAKLRKITDDGVVFTSSLDGSEHLMTAERSMGIQRGLGSDIIMAFDECPPGDAPSQNVEAAVDRTTRWTQRCFAYLRENPPIYENDSHFFPIIQGAVSKKLRRKSVEELSPYIETGVAVGGLAVGEDKETMFDTLSLMDELLPKDKCRYLMGVGKPHDIVRAVSRGMDMFDCVIPTRNARNGQLFTWNGKINILNKKYAKDYSPVEKECTCYGCQTFTRAYLRHLFKLNEILGLYIASLHNVTFYLSLMSMIQTQIEQGTFESWSEQFMEAYRDEGHV